MNVSTYVHDSDYMINDVAQFFFFTSDVKVKNL